MNSVGATLARGAGAHDNRTLSGSVVFLDRDGVLIENRDDYVKRWEEVRFLPGVLQALRRLSESGRAAVIVTNQSAVGRGIISLQEAVDLHQQIVAAIEDQGGRIDYWYLCPHRPADGCQCRKPAPGMLLQAGSELGLDLAASWLVGDAATDIEAARTAGVQPILVRTGRGNDQVEALTNDAAAGCPVVADLEAALDYIL
jgi:D-glycero-D-manno-heptose 1,7-bisphosphate phosphatase